jgi:hypothetical protein
VYGGTRRKEVEKIWPWYGLTLYIKVRLLDTSSLETCVILFLDLLLIHLQGGLWVHYGRASD